MKQDVTQSGSETARSEAQDASSNHRWLSSPWTGVAVTSGITVLAMAIGKEAASLLGWSLIWAFPIALPLIALQMWGLARIVRGLRGPEAEEAAETQLDLAA